MGAGSINLRASQVLEESGGTSHGGEKIATTCLNEDSAAAGRRLSESLERPLPETDSAEQSAIEEELTEVTELATDMHRLQMDDPAQALTIEQ